MNFSLLEKTWLILKYQFDSYEMKKRLYKETDNPALSTSLNNIGQIYK